jgi:hypothetical protein
MTKARNILMSALALLVCPVSSDEAVAQAGPNTARGNSPPTLHAPDSPQKEPDAAGFIQRWLILDPINIGNQQAENASKAAVKVEYFPNQLTILPHDGDKVTFGNQELTWHAEDTIYYNVNLYLFAHALKKSSDGALFWAVTIVNCPQDIPNVHLAIGSNASSVWWLNGQEVAGVYGDRQTVIDDGVSKALTLKKGPNVLRCAIINGSGATDFCARFLDANDKPLTGFTVSAGEVAGAN